MRSVTLSSEKRGWLRWAAGLVALLFAPALHAQIGQLTDPNPPDPVLPEIKPVPVFSVQTGFVTFFEGGTPHLGPLVSPLLLVPIGQKWLIESRVTLESDLAPEPGSPGFKGNLESSVDYLQLDYIANKYVTVSVGRYLTPFGIYNERLYPIFIRDLQTDPLILGIEAGEYGAGTGAMLRGGFDTVHGIEVNYAAYFSANSTVEHMESDRSAGGRVGIFLPGPRLEVGGSFQHLLQEERKNSFGFHFEWQPPPLPLDIRAEYARSHDGSGYWVESAYKLSQVPMWRNTMRHFQVVARMQQFFVNSAEEDTVGEDDDEGITVNTKMFEFGVNYYFRDDFRFVSSYGRQFAPDGGNANIWTVGLTYRLALPLGHGDIP